MAVEALPSPDYSAPPTALDVERKIRGANWWPQDEGQIALAQYAAEVAVRGATRRFLSLVRWEPFLSSGEIETRYFRHIDEEGIIQLGDGLLASESNAVTVKVLGRAYALNQNAFLLPDNARVQRKPYTAIQLWPANAGYGGWLNDGYPPGPRELRPRAIEVTGEWGYCSVWPEDAWEAILSTAGRITLAAVNQESELSSISEDGYSEAYDLVGPIDQKTALGQWGEVMSLKDVAAKYSKKGLGAMTLNTGAAAARNARSYLPLA